MRRLFITAMLIILATVTSARDVVSVHINTNQGFAPLKARIMIRVEPNRENRRLYLTWDSEDGEYGQSIVSDSLDSLDADRETFNVERKFGIGTYIIQATVVRVHDGKPSYSVAQTHLNVLEPGTPFVR